MISLKPFLALAAAALGGVRAGTTVWSGSFNPFTSAADFDKCTVSCFNFIVNFVVDFLTDFLSQGPGQAKLERTNGTSMVLNPPHITSPWIQATRTLLIPPRHMD